MALVRFGGNDTVSTVKVNVPDTFGRKESSGLKAFLLEEGVRLVQPRASSIKVNDALAITVFNAERVPCPHVGEAPSFFTDAEHHAVLIEDQDDPFVIETCGACGLHKVFSKSDSSSLDRRFVHEQRDCLRGKRSLGTIHSASWDGHQLVPTEEENTGYLIIWIYGRWCWNKNRSKNTAFRTYPYASIVHEENNFILIEED